MPPEQLTFGNNLYDVVSLNATILGKPCLLLKRINDRAQKNEYTHLTRNTMRFLKMSTNEDAVLYHHLRNLPMEKKETNPLFYKLSDLVFFSKVYEFDDYVVGSIFNNRNKKIWDEQEMLQKLDHFQIQVTEVLSNCNALISKKELESFEEVKKEDYVLSDSEVESFLIELDSDDAVILRHALTIIGVSLVNTPTGVIRFKSEPLSEKEQFIVDDLNRAWIDYYHGKISLRDIIEARAKDQASVQYFFDSFAGQFYDEVANEQTDEFEYVLKTDEEIKEMLKK